MGAVAKTAMSKKAADSKEAIEVLAPASKFTADLEKDPADGKPEKTPATILDSP
jgi:hypothetical protein